MSPPPKLLDQGREALRIKHYALRTEQAYVSWIKRFVFKEPVGIDPRLHTCCLGHAPVDFGACDTGASRSKRDTENTEKTKKLSVFRSEIFDFGKTLHFYPLPS